MIAGRDAGDRLVQGLVVVGDARDHGLADQHVGLDLGAFGRENRFGGQIAIHLVASFQDVVPVRTHVGDFLLGRVGTQKDDDGGDREEQEEGDRQSFDRLGELGLLFRDDRDLDRCLVLSHDRVPLKGSS